MPRHADALRERMYHDAFETDSDMQKWDSGCWIRYKMFENALEETPTVDAVEVVRCKDCKWQITAYCPMPSWERKDNHYCYKGEKMDEVRDD